MKCLVFGGAGQLGRDVCTVFEASCCDVIAPSHSDCDVCDSGSVNSLVSEIKPDCIVNAAAAHHVEMCEDKPDVAFLVNAVGVRNLAMAADVCSSHLIHVSTDYVFDGKTNVPYVETDLPVPLNVYGASKLAGEAFVLNYCSRGTVMRTSGLYGLTPCRAKGRNFVELMLHLATVRDQIRVVDDEILTPTSTAELAKQIFQVAQSGLAGLYHATAEGQCSWYEFAKAVFEEAQLKVDLQKAQPGEFPVKVPRPAFSVLENAALKDASCTPFKHWRLGLREYMKSR